MNPFKPKFLIVLAGALAMSACSTMKGSSESQSQQQAMTPAKMADAMALNELHHINQKEITLAQMAQKKAQSAEVKSTAETILTDHQNLDASVQAMASQQGVKLMDFSPATYEKVTMENLEMLSGPQFDQGFLRNMIQGHRMAVDQLRLTRREVMNPEVAGLIDQAMPKIRSHTHMSQDSASSLSGDRSSSRGSG